MNHNLVFCYALVEILIQKKINCFFFSPGARNSPLTFSLLKEKKITLISHFDERGLAYLALGWIKKTGQPAVIISTSGSAIANFFPALLDAFFNSYPLILITADRPGSLQNLGANQTINQTSFFHRYVIFFKNFIVEENIPLDYHFFQLTYGLNKIEQGPIHFNLQFDEPLIKLKKNHFSKKKKYFTITSGGEKTNFNFPAIPKVLKCIEGAKFPLIVLGKMEVFKEKKSIVNFLNFLQVPFLLDITSNLQGKINSLEIGKHYFKNHSLVFKNEKIKKKIIAQTDFVLHLGREVTSKETNEVLAKIKGEYFQVDDSYQPYNPQLNINTKITCEENRFSQLILDYGNKQKRKKNTVFPFMAKINRYINNYFKTSQSFNEITIAYQIVNSLSRLRSCDFNLYLGNSSIVRNFDLVSSAEKKDISILVHRGTSGIEGFIAASVGSHLSFKKGRKKNQKTWLILGDMSSLHDMNSLVLIKREKIKNWVLVIINNQEGTIFRDLPFNNFFTREEKKFIFYQHDFNFKWIAKEFGLVYKVANNRLELEQGLAIIENQTKSFVFELRINPENNYKARQSFFKEISKIAI